MLLVPGVPTWSVVIVKLLAILGFPLIFASLAHAGVTGAIPGGDLLEQHSTEAILTMLLLQNVFGFKFGNAKDKSDEILSKVEHLSLLHAPVRHGDALVYDWKLNEEDKAAIRSLPRLVMAVEDALQRVSG